ncbi:MAG TPA: 3-oxoacyl-[acyl-carrier-protein] synthase III C-terminal domain-containing protein [Candidatus Dormibacteraeota bacterium]
MTIGQAPLGAGVDRRAGAESAAVEVAPTPVGVAIAGLGTALPSHRITTVDLAAALPRVWPGLERRMSTLLPQLEGCERHLARPLDEMTTALPLGEQTSRYLETALALAASASRQALSAAAVDPASVGCVVVTSCTGFILPGLDVRLIPVLGLRDDLVRLPFAQLGCAGGAAGLACAADWVRTHAGAAALVVAVELPSVTFRPGDTSLDNLLSAVVFGDGAAAALLTGAGERALAPSEYPGSPVPTIGRTWSIVLPDSTAALGYEMADDGYRVILSRSLPRQLEEALPTLAARCLGERRAADVDVVVAHPGGPAILEAVQRGLGLRDEQLAASWAALRRTGNTSSAAVLFVLEKLRHAGLGAGATGLLLAFGPGLAVELLELEWRG